MMISRSLSGRRARWVSACVRNCSTRKSPGSLAAAGPHQAGPDRVLGTLYPVELVRLRDPRRTRSTTTSCASTGRCARFPTRCRPRRCRWSPGPTSEPSFRWDPSQRWGPSWTTSRSRRRKACAATALRPSPSPQRAMRSTTRWPRLLLRPAHLLPRRVAA